VTRGPFFTASQATDGYEVVFQDKIPTDDTVADLNQLLALHLDEERVSINGPSYPLERY
jgi:hypothetical protein